VIEDVSISNDGKIILICDKKYIYTLSLEQEDEMKQVHDFPIGSIVSLAFLPQSTSEGHYSLFVTYGKYSTTLQVNTNEGIIHDPSLLLRCFAVCDDESMTELIPKHKELLYKRDENGRTLAELTVDYTIDLQFCVKFLKLSHPLIAWSSQDVVRYVLLTSKEDLVERITIEKSCVFSFADPDDLENHSALIPELAENGSIDMIYYLLQAGLQILQMALSQVSRCIRKRSSTIEDCCDH
jgi:hypothetical protein